MTRVRAAGRRTFAALSVRNYRLFFRGQIISVSGTWMQTVAQAWLVLSLTDSGIALGLVTAAQFLPMLLLGPWGGVLADRVDKRRFLVGTQVAAAICAATLGILVVSGVIEVWMVAVVAVLLGVVNALDVPVRQSFVSELVGPDLLPNAVSLSSTVMHAARIVGPAMAGVLIAVWGTGACFLLNAASYGAALVALSMMRPSELHRTEPRPRAAGQLREGLRYVWATPALRTPLLLMATIGTLTYEFGVSLPLLARYTFGTGAGGYSVMLATMSVGAVIGGLVAAATNRASHRRLGLAGAGLGALTLTIALAPTFGAALVVLPLLGAVSVMFITLANATLQLTAAPEMRGRVVALYAVAFLGTTPIGGPVIGAIAEGAGARAALVLGGVVALVATALSWRSLSASEAAGSANVIARSAPVAALPASPGATVGPGACVPPTPRPLEVAPRPAA